MDLKKLATAIDAQVASGDIIGAFETFAADHCTTFSNPNDVTRSKGQKLEALRWFMDNIAKINRIECPAMQVVGDNETHSGYHFDFTNKQGESLVYNEVIRRVWENGQLVEEEYRIGETLVPASKTKKAKSDAAPAAEKPAPAKKTATEKAAAPKKVAEKPAEAPAKKTATAKAAAPKKVAEKPAEAPAKPAAAKKTTAKKK